MISNLSEKLNLTFILRWNELLCDLKVIMSLKKKLYLKLESENIEV